MLLDHNLKMSKAQAITSSAASTDVLDLQKAGDAVGNELYLVVQTRADFDSSGDSGTLAIALQTSNSEAFGTYNTLLAVSAISQTGLTADKTIVKSKLPPGVKRYVRAYYTVASGPFTAGAVDAFLVPDAPVG